MSKIKRINREQSRLDQKYISRIKKTLYYGKLQKTDTFSVPVTELAAELFSEPQYGRSLDRLHCDDAASISRNACVSSCSLVIAVLYLERLRKTCPEYLEKTASTDLFLVSLMVSSKFLYDDGETQEVVVDKWAEAGGMSLKQLVQLEREFLKAIEWNVYVHEQLFWKKLNELECCVAQRQGISRGFFTYTELKTLLLAIRLQPFIQYFVSASVILIASYAATFVLIFGSINLIKHSQDTQIQERMGNIELNERVFNSTDNDVIEGLEIDNATNIEEFLEGSQSLNVTKHDLIGWLLPTVIWLAETTKEFKFTGQLFNYDVFPEKIFENDIPKSTMLGIGDKGDFYCKYVAYSNCPNLIF